MTSPVPALVLDLVLLRALLRDSRLRPGLRDRAETVLTATIHHLRRPADAPAPDAAPELADGPDPRPYWNRD